MLSNATTDKLRAMTQHAVESCVGGANSLPVNVTVLEQAPDVRYDFAKTVRMPEAFNYNRFANYGAGLGEADWIMVANNDLIFYDGWLHALLAADHLAVSPRCPRAHPKVTENLTGTQTGLHLAGWCFMVRRSLWELISGFDDCVSYWCSDDVVVEQLKAVDVEPMLVADSLVEHLRSVTLPAPPDELTWAQVDIFNRRYRRHRLAESPEFRRWEAYRSRESRRR